MEIERIAVGMPVHVKRAWCGGRPFDATVTGKDTQARAVYVTADFIDGSMCVMARDVAPIEVAR